jgi:hypothetical protein
MHVIKNFMCHTLLFCHNQSHKQTNKNKKMLASNGGGGEG